MATHVVRALAATIFVVALLCVLAVASLAADVPAAVVRFDGASFSPSTLSVRHGETIELWNDTNRDLRLAVSPGLPPTFSAHTVFLPVITRDGDAPELQSSAQSASPDLRFPARSAVQLEFGDAGPWTVALTGLDAVAIAVIVQEPESTPTSTATATAAPTPLPTPTQVPVTLREWTFHKSTDGAHPDGNEQQMVWLMNRARSNPAPKVFGWPRPITRTSLIPAATSRWILRCFRLSLPVIWHAHRPRSTCGFTTQPGSTQRI